MTTALLFDIVFQSGEFYDQANNWWLTLLNTILGAAIGSGATIGAVYLTFRHEKANEERKLAAARVDKIRYLKSLVETIIEDTKLQIEKYLEFASAVKDDPIKLPLLKQIPQNELAQIVTQLNQEDYYHAYLVVFADKGAKVDDFRSIISILNYMHENIKSHNLSLMKSFEHSHERKLEFKTAFEGAQDYASGLIANQRMQSMYIDFVKLLDAFFSSYNTGRKDPSDLTYAFDNYIVPLMTELLKFVDSVPEAHDLLLKLRNASLAYNSILLHNDSLADQYMELNDTMDKAHQKLVERTKDLTGFIN